MKFDKSVKKQNTPEGFRYYIDGPGRIDDSKPIDLPEAVTPDLIDGQPAYDIGGNFSLIKFSIEKGNTVYDVVVDFDPNGKESVLKQFQKIILSDKE